MSCTERNAAQVLRRSQSTHPITIQLDLPAMGRYELYLRPPRADGVFRRDGSVGASHTLGKFLADQNDKSADNVIYGSACPHFVKEKIA
jgi:hypothetical protein